jgi:hypothetical protein
MNRLKQKKKCIEECFIDKCYDCWIANNHDESQRQEIDNERKENLTTREKFENKWKESKTGFLILSDKKIEWFATKQKFQEWEKNAEKKSIQWDLINLEAYHEFKKENDL